MLNRPNTTPNPDLILDPEPFSRAAGKRFTIYYQKDNIAPVAPDILSVADPGNSGIDIADPLKATLIDYLVASTEANNIIPIAIDETDQRQHVSSDSRLNAGMFDAAAINYQDMPPTAMFVAQSFDAASISSTSDINFSNLSNTPGVASPTQNQRIFRIKNYVDRISSGNASDHGKLIDAEQFRANGLNDANRFITPALNDIKNNKEIGNSLQVGNVFYTKLGAYKSSSYAGQPILNGGNVTSVPLSMARMQDIAINQSIDAVLGDANPSFKYDSTDLSSDIQAELAMAIPSPQRLGKKVKLNKFSTSREIEKVLGISKPENGTGILLDNSDYLESYGSFYNQFSKFNGLIVAGQVTVCVGMVLAFSALLSSIGAIIPRNSNINDPTNTNISFVSLTANEKRSLLGKLYVDGNAKFPSNAVGGLDFLTQTLDVQSLFTPTQNSPDDCLLLGIQEFFGFSFGTGLGGLATPASAQAATASLRILKESGRLTVIMREILRSGLDIIDLTISDFSDGFSIGSLTNLLERIRDTKIIKFVNVLMQIGDAVKNEDNLKIDAVLNGNPEFNVSASSNVSYVDSLPDRLVHSKGRLSDGRTAWSTSTAQNAIMPFDRLFVNSINDALGNGAVRNSSTPPTLLNRTEFASKAERNAAISEGRLPVEVVKRVEQQLEMDYMPFYFQDLRTNEIMSFHAFLDEVGENFNVDYASTDAYGRQDSVNIYKSTKRSINVSFKMVATSEQDMSLVWFKLNRLAMMIYPQWTNGREINLGNNLKFTQPFSQIPGATPVVRLRLGDLFKSNYSKLSVLRLFGASTRQDYNINGATQQQKGNASNGTTSPREQTPDLAAPSQTNPGSTNLQARQRFLEDISITLTDGNSDERASPQRINPDQIFSRDSTIVVLKVGPMASSIRNLRANGRRINANHSRGRLYATYGGVVSGTQRVSLTILSYKRDAATDNATETVTSTGGSTTTISVPINPVFQNALDRSTTASEMQRTANSDAAAEQRQTQPPSGPISRNGLDSITTENFYDETKNPIMRSYQSTYGKGLAGVIKNFSVAYEKDLWSVEGADNLRAPKIITVTIDMDVIHDSPIGLDANGTMMAPIWPVGNYSTVFAPEDSGASMTPVGDRTSRDGQLTSRFDPSVNSTFNRKR
jgi:hypothetical protein